MSRHRVSKGWRRVERADRGTRANYHNQSNLLRAGNLHNMLGVLRLKAVDIYVYYCWTFAQDFG